MSAIRTFFRHCPSCGRRFEIRLVGKELVGSESLSEDGKHIEVAGFPVSAVRPTAIVVEGDVPSIVDIEEFQYTYRCKHCGHEWSEVHETERRFDRPEGYTGD